MKVNASVSFHSLKPPTAGIIYAFLECLCYMEKMEFGRKCSLKKKKGDREELWADWKSNGARVKKGQSRKRPQHLHFQLGGSFSVTVYLARAAIISAGRRRAAPVIDKRLHL